MGWLPLLRGWANEGNWAEEGAVNPNHEFMRGRVASFDFEFVTATLGSEVEKRCLELLHDVRYLNLPDNEIIDLAIQSVGTLDEIGCLNDVPFSSE